MECTGCRRCIFCVVKVIGLSSRLTQFAAPSNPGPSFVHFFLPCDAECCVSCTCALLQHRDRTPELRWKCTR